MHALGYGVNPHYTTNTEHHIMVWRRGPQNMTVGQNVVHANNYAIPVLYNQKRWKRVWSEQKASARLEEKED